MLVASGYVGAETSEFHNSFPTCDDDNLLDRVELRSRTCALCRCSRVLYAAWKPSHRRAYHLCTKFNRGRRSCESFVD